MHQQVTNIIRSLKTKTKYNILTFDTHERCQSQMAKTGHNFYSFRYQNCKEWNTKFADIPSNYYILKEIPECLDFDFILSQSKFGQLQVSKQLQQRLDIPIIHLEHTIPTSNYSPQQLEVFKQIWGDYNVFISEYARDSWGFNEHNSTVITNSIDGDFFKPVDVESDGTVFTVQNDFVNRDYCLNYQGWQRIVEGFPVKILGDTPGVSEPAESLEHLRDEYNKCAVYINTTTESQMPTAILEAMACGKPVVSTATCSIPSFIKHGHNGFLTNDEQEFRNCIKMLLEEPELARMIGRHARQTALDIFSEDKYTTNWNNMFTKVYEDQK